MVKINRSVNIKSLSMWEVTPSSESLEEVLHISNEKSKQQEAQSNNAHGKQDFWNKVAWSLISS